MFRLQFLRSVLHKISRLRSQETSRNAVVIAAAVRTPNSFCYSNEEEQLAGLVIDELVKRTSVPRDEFKKLILCTSSDFVNNDSLSSVAKNLGLKSCQTHAIQNESCSVYGLQMSLECLQNEQVDWVILGDTRARISSDEPTIPRELLTQTWPSRRSTQQTKYARNNSESIDTPGAAALALTTVKTAERLQLQPLALVREFFMEDNNDHATFRLDDSKPLHLEDVYNWQLVINQDLYDQLNKLISMRDVRTHDAKQITASHLLTHTVHALPAGEMGCVIMESGDGRLVLMVLQKIIPDAQLSEGLPQLTLYTKEPCPLCDELVVQLEKHFAGEFELKKVFIDRKENVRYLRLFRYDIPVLFLNGQFLCMHNLNEKLLRERLDELKAISAKK